jgi:fructose-specific phosphotransferase system IIA component
MDFLTREQIIFNKKLATRSEIIKVISEKAVELGISNQLQELIQSFINREELGSTGFGNGFAIPHARCSYVNEAKIIIVKSEIPIEWEAIDDKPVYIAIALLVPESNVDNIHIKILSSVSRKLMNSEFRECLLKANSSDEVLELFEEVIVQI